MFGVKLIKPLIFWGEVWSCEKACRLKRNLFLRYKSARHPLTTPSSRAFLLTFSSAICFLFLFSSFDQTRAVGSISSKKFACIRQEGVKNGAEGTRKPIWDAHLSFSCISHHIKVSQTSSCVHQNLASHFARLSLDYRYL